MGVDTKLYIYPGSSHPLLEVVEHTFDAYLNMGLWMDKYLIQPYAAIDEPTEEDKIDPHPK